VRGGEGRKVCLGVGALRRAYEREYAGLRTASHARIHARTRARAHTHTHTMCARKGWEMGGRIRSDHYERILCGDEYTPDAPASR
jgi:hypothetical protein